MLTYTTASPPIISTDHDEQHLIELCLIAEYDIAGAVVSAIKQAYTV
jgi:hypothetical protein